MKKVVVTSLDNLLIKHPAFVEPHKAWFDRVIKKTKDKSLAKWKGRKDYFLGVNEAMDKIMPKATRKQKTSKAREWYQKDVIKYIKDHPKIVNIKLKKKLESLKKNYTNYVLNIPFEHQCASTRQDVTGESDKREEARKRFIEMWEGFLPVDVSTIIEKLSGIFKRAT